MSTERASTHRPGQGLVPRRRGEPVAAVVAYVRPDLRTAAKVHAAKSGITVSDLIASALADRLGHGVR